MDYLNRVLCRNNYPEFIPEKKPNTRPQGDQPTSQDTTKEVFISIPYIPGLNEEFRRIFMGTKAQIIFKGCNILKSLLMHTKDKVPPLAQGNSISIVLLHILENQVDV